MLNELSLPSNPFRVGFEPYDGYYDVVADACGIAIRRAVVRAIVSETMQAEREACVPASWAFASYYKSDERYGGWASTITGVDRGIRLTVEICLMERLPGVWISCSASNLRERPVRLHRIDPLLAEPGSGGGLSLAGNWEDADDQAGGDDPTGAGRDRER